MYITQQNRLWIAQGRISNDKIFAFQLDMNNSKTFGLRLFPGGVLLVPPKTIYLIVDGYEYHRNKIMFA